MATINNGDIIRRLISEAKINIAVDDVPMKLAEKVVPVLNCNPKHNLRVITKVISDSASGTAFTSSTTKDTYIVGCSLSVNKDVNSTAVNSDIACTPYGDTLQSIMLISFEPLTAGQIANTIILPMPLKIEKGSPIYVRNSSAVASIDANGIIYYYEVD